ncbi:MAG TPA: helix-turn-helix domain-containing protein [Solirubrobacterales bacterium]|nr:helix-turn-helix domain-containing protein [Solirubrobacterales bacterium]
MARSGKRGSKGKGPDGDRQANLICALNHRLRRRLLRLLQASGGPCSPARLAETLDESLSNVSYHIKVLVGFEAVKRAGEEQVRGTIEHFYLPTVGDNAPIQALLEETRGSDEV